MRTLIVCLIFAIGRPASVAAGTVGGLAKSTRTLLESVRKLSPKKAKILSQAIRRNDFNGKTFISIDFSGMNLQSVFNHAVLIDSNL